MAGGSEAAAPPSVFAVAGATFGAGHFSWQVQCLVN